MTPTTRLPSTPPGPPRCIEVGVRRLERAQARSSKPRLTLGQEGSSKLDFVNPVNPVYLFFSAPLRLCGSIIVFVFLRVLCVLRV